LLSLRLRNPFPSPRTRNALLGPCCKTGAFFPTSRESWRVSEQHTTLAYTHRHLQAGDSTAVPSDTQPKKTTPLRFFSSAAESGKSVIQGRRCTRQLPIPSPVSLCAADRGQPRREINAASWPDTCITYWIYPSAVMQSDQCRAESRRSRHAVVQEGLSGIRFQHEYAGMRAFDSSRST
jgi:hypothetical protein